MLKTRFRIKPSIIESHTFPAPGREVSDDVLEESMHTVVVQTGPSVCDFIAVSCCLGKKASANT